MIAANHPIQRPADAKLLIVDALGDTSVMARRGWTALLRPGDLVVANDAANPAGESHGPPRAQPGAR